MIDVYYFKLHMNCIYIQGFNDVSICTYPSTESSRSVGVGSQGHSRVGYWLSYRGIAWVLSGRRLTTMVGGRHCNVAHIRHLALPKIWHMAFP